MSRYDTIEEVRKHSSEAKTFEEILKFNENHDRLGRFSSSSGAGGAAGVPGGATKYAIQHTEQKAHNRDDYGLAGENKIPTDKTYDKVAQDLQVSKETAKTMVDAIGDYSRQHYDAIRKASRGEKASEADKKKAADIEEFIDASPKWAGGAIYRGIGTKDFDTAYEILSNVRQGKPVDMGGVSSWSSNSKVAEGFGKRKTASAGKTIVFVTNGKSTNKATSISHLSRYKYEDEVLVSKKAVFTPTKMTKRGEIIYVYGDVA